VQRSDSRWCFRDTTHANRERRRRARTLTQLPRAVYLGAAMAVAANRSAALTQRSPSVRSERCRAFAERHAASRGPRCAQHADRAAVNFWFRAKGSLRWFIGPGQWEQDELAHSVRNSEPAMRTGAMALGEIGVSGTDALGEGPAQRRGRAAQRLVSSRRRDWRPSVSALAPIVYGDRAALERLR
jgi:hypothetical protein